MNRMMNLLPSNFPIRAFFQPFEGHEEEKMGSVVSGAVITSNGKLTDKFKYISDLREANMNGHTQVSGDFKSDKKVLIKTPKCLY